MKLTKEKTGMTEKMTDSKSNITASDIAQMLASSERILIFTHAQPDGDTLGSAYALKNALPEKDVRVVCSTSVPEYLRFLCDGKAEIRLDDGFEPDLTCAVDIAEIGMIGEYAEKFGDRIDIKIDHHLTSIPFAKYNLIEPSAAACAEVIFEIVKGLGALNEKSAYYLYTGIATDTGCFKYRNVTAKSHTITAELLGYGFDVGKLNNLLFESKSRNEIEATKLALNNLHYYENGKIAVVVFTNRMKMEYGLVDDNLSLLNSLPREITGVELGIVIKEQDNSDGEYKVSMRSGEKVDVSALCGVFGGGGHLRASGCRICASDEKEAERIILDAVKERVNFEE